VSFEDGCARSSWRIGGGLTFADLEAATTSGKRLLLPAGVETVVGRRLHLAGLPAARLGLASDAPGVAALLNLGVAGSQDIAAISAADVWATGQFLAPGPPANYQSVDAGGLRRIFASGIAVVPTLDTWGALLLAFALAATALLWMRRS
jgi:hypothetical protein